MLSTIRPAVVLFVLMTLLTGVVYPAIVTGIAKLAFRHQAEGSIVDVDGKSIGSELIAQPFTDSKYFWPRASAANYDATASAGSNLSPTNPALADAVKSRIDALRAVDSANTAAVPVDLVTASASGLDPHISVAAARYQAFRVAQARGITPDVCGRLIDQATESALFGDSTVNVLHLNLMLDHPSNPPGSGEVPGWRARGFMTESN